MTCPTALPVFHQSFVASQPDGDVLKEKPMSQSELAAQLEVALVSVNKAVASLHDKGLITPPRRGEKLKILEDWR